MIFCVLVIISCGILIVCILFTPYKCSYKMIIKHNKILDINYLSCIRSSFMVLFLFCSFALSVFSQESKKSNDRLKLEIMLLIDKAYHQNRIDIAMRDSLSSFISSTIFQKSISRETEKVELASNFDESLILEELKLFLLKNLKEPDYRAMSPNSMLPSELPAPQKENEHIFIPSLPPSSKIKGASLNKGIEGFYKNKQYAKSIDPSWNNEQINIDAANRAMTSISRNLQYLNFYKPPSFIQNMTQSKSLFVRMLGGFFGILDNGAQTQLSGSLPKVGGQPYFDKSIFFSPSFDPDVYIPAPIKKEAKYNKKKVKRDRKNRK